MDVHTTGPQFDEYPPVETFLGAETLEVLAKPERVKSYIIQDGPTRWDLGFSGCEILAEGPLLNEEQMTRLISFILTPEAYCNCGPFFRRFPSVPNFAYLIWSGNRVLDVLVDLHNPGWEFHCGSERYDNWNWVGEQMVALAKELFPHFASPRSNSVWRKGAIKLLKEKPKRKTAGRRERKT